MIGITDFEKEKHIQTVVINQSQCNRMWGVEYILMDSKAFRNSNNSSEYQSIIEMFIKIRNVELVV
jgi:hypothetical protein